MPPKKKAEAEAPPAGDVSVETADPEAMQARIAELEQQLEDAGKTTEELEAKVAELEEQLTNQPSAPATPAEDARSGKTRRITYLGRPHLLARNADGDVTEDDVYSGMDLWSDVGTVTLKVGETATVSAEKADQLAADDPDSFEIE